MSLRILILFLMSVSSSLLNAQTAVPDPLPITIGSTWQLESAIFGGPREINVWMPPGYTTGEKKYPVLYVIDGGLAQDFQHIAGLAQLATVNGSFRELIVVGIRTQIRIAELTHPPTDPRYIAEYPTAGKSGDFLNHITDEVIPFIDRTFRVRRRRAIIGESLAGLFVTDVFLNHPESFTDYIAISPSLWWDDKALGKAAAERLATHDDQPRKLYLTMANEGGTMRNGLDMILQAIEATSPEGLKLYFVDRSETEIHSTIYHGAAHDALLKLFGYPRPLFGVRPWYLTEGGQPPEKEKQNQ